MVLFRFFLNEIVYCLSCMTLTIYGGVLLLENNQGGGRVMRPAAEWSYNVFYSSYSIEIWVPVAEGSLIVTTSSVNVKYILCYKQHVFNTFIISTLVPCEWVIQFYFCQSMFLCNIWPMRFKNLTSLWYKIYPLLIVSQAALWTSQTWRW